MDYNEKNFIENILNISCKKNNDIFVKVKNVLVDAKIIIENPINIFSTNKNITLKEIVKIEQILGIEIISFPTEKEWLVINRRRKIEKIEKLNR